MNDDNLFEFEEVDGGARSPHLVPWLVTGLIAIVALLMAVVVLNISKDAIQAESTPPAVEQPEDETGQQPEQPDSESGTEVEPEPAPEPEPELPPSGKPDDAIDTSQVVIGDSFVLDIEHGWDITTDVPHKFGDWRYQIVDGDKIVLYQSDLINSLPASCEAQKTSWGLERSESGEITALSPQQVCEENKDLYTELLGLVRHMSETVRPLSN